MISILQLLFSSFNIRFMKDIPKYLKLLLLLLTACVVWHALNGNVLQTQGDVYPVQTFVSGKFTASNWQSDHAQVKQQEEVQVGKPLAIPVADISEQQVDYENAVANAREFSDDDAVLAVGGLSESNVKVPEVSEELRKTRLKSIVAKDWSESANLLVNELRAGRGFEVPLENVEAFLKGKELFGWSEGQRNWIGDEMMTMLRQELPQKAYELFSNIQADDNAPDALRDYSIQHISHLIADGQVGQEGADLIRAAYESGNSVLASTALISLHRLSEKAPELVKADDVKRYAQDSVNSTDERLKATSQAILKEVK